MNIYSILQLCGGLAFFLFGMHVMSGSLEKLAGGNLQKILKEVTSNPIKSLFFGAIVTIAIQSSSALTVMLVGLVNSGIMELAQTVGVIMGSNIGTTLTAWILSLSGIESDNLFISMLKPENFSPVIALIGVIMIMGSKKEKRKDVGIIMAGFAVLMYGMQLMSGAVSPLADMPEFTGLLTTFNNPFLGVLVGAVFTGVIQSSAASVGVLQALAMTGAISYSMAIPIIMGQNIGTCVTALLSSIGVNKNAKRVSIIHISFNLFGTAIGLVVYCIARYAVDLTLFNDSITPVMIAVFHSIFNIATTIILLPFSNTLVKIAKKLVTTDNADGQVVLDERLLLSPGLAVKECLEKTNEMAELARDSFKNALDLFDNYSDSKFDDIEVMEEQLDYLEDQLDTFLIHLSGKDVSEADGKITVRLHTGEPSIYGAVREQMDELDTLLIPYESCPGVSACFGAAASLNIEYTLPGISQSLIITRMEGRTKVPPKESIASFASHHASMAIYLSTGLLEKLTESLIEGGYAADTPAAIVYKATWPQEEAYVCTVATLEQTAREHNITKTAIVLVGDVIAHRHYEKSRLYAPDFSTEYRKASVESQDND